MDLRNFMSISAFNFSAYDPLMLSNRNINVDQSNIFTFQRRISSTKTLDNGVYVLDSGYVAVDKAVSVVANLNEEEAAAMEYYNKIAGEVVLIIGSEAFVGVVSSIQNLYTVARIEFTLKRLISA